VVVVFSTCLPVRLKENEDPVLSIDAGQQPASLTQRRGKANNIPESDD
jgi:hypothetical protein